MNTKITTGIGNYIKSESLFLSGIDPRRLCKNISTEEMELLYNNIKKVMELSVEAGGFTQKDYFSLYGKPGKYEPVIYKFTSKNGFPVLKGTFDDKRTSWFCPEYQK
jgi:formamidopyrimidine-DNA glycosylase